MEKRLFKNWWLLTIKGLIAILFGIILVSVPEESLKFMVRWFGIIVALGGIFLIFGAYSHKEHNLKWRNWLWEGILDIAIGLVIVIFTEFSISIFLMLIAVWAIIVGFTHLFNALSAHKETKAKWMMLLNALIVIVFAIVLFTKPFDTAGILTILAGVFAIIFGVFITLFSIQLKGLKKE